MRRRDVRAAGRGADGNELPSGDGRLGLADGTVVRVPHCHRAREATLREDFNFFIEHTHRILGWTVGGMVSVLAISVWSTQRRSVGWWVGLAGILILLGGFGEFHDAMRRQVPLSAKEVKLPVAPAAVTLVGLVIAFGAAGVGLLTGKRGSGLRLVGMLALVAVMIQGLLGGFRVKLNELAGTDLAAIHGIFAQVVFGLLVSIAVLTGRPASATMPTTKSRGWAVGLAVLLFVQVVWGALVRHDPSPLTQRLHYLTAFLATGVAVWVLMQFKADRTARARVLPGNILLMVLLTLQLMLGVEAWMEKFGAYTLPELVPITKTNAAIRTLHALVGSALLATAVGIAVRLRQVAGVVSEGGAAVET